MEVSRKRKRNDPFLWDEHKAYLEKLYLHEKKTAKEIVKIMRKEYGFDTTYVLFYPYYEIINRSGS
jgi:hypothetical protein